MRGSCFFFCPGDFKPWRDWHMFSVNWLKYLKTDIGASHVLFSGSFPSLWMGSALDNLECRCSHSMFFLCLKDSKYPPHRRCSLCLNDLNISTCSPISCAPVSQNYRRGYNIVLFFWLLPLFLTNLSEESQFWILQNTELSISCLFLSQQFQSIHGMADALSFWTISYINMLA